MVMPLSIEAGSRFGRLVATTRLTHKGRKQWLCVCDCGGTTISTSTDLRRGHSRSCGCYRREQASLKNRTHGATTGRKASSEYQIWAAMIQRCSNPQKKDYHRYGGRGITVCERWESFENFFEDMGQRPGPDHEIDRTDNNARYNPDNCRWVTHTENSRNRSIVRLNTDMARQIREFRDNGARISHVARDMGIPLGTVSNVWYERGWQ